MASEDSHVPGVRGEWGLDEGRAAGGRGAGWGVGGGSSILAASREEPPRVSYAEVSLSLPAPNTHTGFLRAAGGGGAGPRPEPGLGGRRSPPALPTRTEPGPGAGYVTCRRARPLGLRGPRRPCPVRVLLPWTHEGVPLQAKRPLSRQVGGVEARAGPKGTY